MAPAQRIVAFAGGVLGTTLLDVLASHATPVAVVASPRLGEDGRPPCPLTRLWARRRGVELLEVPTWKDAEATARLAALRPDLLLSLSYDLVLPPEALATAPRAVNLHRGIAPDLRGAYSTTWALELGHPEVGVTLHAMTPDVDAGAILAQARIPVAPAWTAHEAIPAVEQLAVDTFRTHAEALVADALEPRPQPEGGRAIGRVLPGHALEDRALRRRLRALHNPPWPGAHVDLGGRRFALAEALDPLPDPDPEQPVPFLAPPPAPGTRGSVAALLHGRATTTFATPADALAAHPHAEDRSDRSLDRALPGREVVLDLRRALGVPHALLVHPHQGSGDLPPLLTHGVDVAAARAACERTALAYAGHLGDLAADDPWPLGTFPQAFAITGPGDGAARLHARGVDARQDGPDRVLLPCHAGTTPAIAARVAREVRAAW